MNIAIIGSNRGIGLELVKQFCDEDFNVYAFCRKKTKQLEEISPYRIIEEFDVTEKDRLSDKLSHGMPEKFDFIINVSGILKEDNEQSFEKDLINQFVVNAIGPINIFRAFSPLLTQGSKFAVLTSQLGSLANNESGGRFGYRMSKAAANMACKNLAIEGLKDKVTVIMLHPGYVEADMTDHNADITTTQSAKGLIKIIKEITSDQSGTFWHVNGQELPW